MNLLEAIAAAGMTPPKRLVSERWMRFPGVGKGPSNRAGWCRLISPTLAIYGDWSTGISETWTDNAHRGSEESTRLLAEARERERQYVRLQRERQQKASEEAARMINGASASPHPYLTRKGFPQLPGLVKGDSLLVPVRDVSSNQLISVQEISPDGIKRFLPGGRTRAGIYRLGVPKARRTVLCEGYATGLSLDAALRRLPGAHCVVVCFSANNLVAVAGEFPNAVVCADNDHSATGEEAAKRTGLKWMMPYEVGTDFNDLHQAMGLHVVTERLREVFA